MRDLIVTAIVVASLPFCFARAWVGILVWSWLGYMNPHRLTWGFAYTMPFAFMVTIATLAGLVVNRGGTRLPRTLPVLLLAALWVTLTLSTAFAAINPEAAWQQLTVVSKILLMTFLTAILFQDRRRLHWLVLVIALSVGFHGAKAGMWVVLKGVQQRVTGPPDTFIADNNDLALALNMVLPLLIFLRRDESRPWVRHGLLAVSFLSVIGVLMTYSRGGLLGLMTVLLLTFVKGPKKIVTLAMLAVAAPLVISMLPQQWFERMHTIGEYEQDESAQGRLTAWSVAWQLALDHPVLGAGFKPFTEETYAHYAPGATVHDVHSSYFQMLAEQGFLGFGLFIGLIGATMISLRQLRRQCAQGHGPPWIGNYAHMLETSLAGYLVAGAFLGRAYFDLFYHMIVIAAVLKSLAAAEPTDEIRTVQPTGPALMRARAQALSTS